VSVSRLPVGVGFPAAVIDGVVLTAANVDKAWINYPAEEKLGHAVGRPVAVANDADVAGLAEVRFGAGAGRKGVVMVLTVGTGIGSGLFVDGKLVPNTELGHLEMRGKDAETRASDAARSRRNLTWDQWAKVFNEYLLMIERLFWPGLIILGGGTSKRVDRFLSKLTVRAPVVPAQLLNDAGIVGAALVAAERFGDGRPDATRRAASRENGRATPEALASSTEIA
jgi:polyphosphate glucokinase